jgi:hypothetical protein
MDNKNDNFTKSEDVLKYNNPSLNVGSFIATNIYGMVNYLNINSLSDKVVPLQVNANTEGNFFLSFAQIADFNSGIYIYLKDNFTNTTTDLKTNNLYPFQINNNPDSKVDGRFQVVFSNKANGIQNNLAEPIAQINVYPNPANEVLHINLVNQNFKSAKLTVFNNAGALVYETETNSMLNTLDVQQLHHGVYHIQVQNIETGKIMHAHFVK